MAYVRRRALGSTTSTLLLSAGANVLVPGSGPIVAVGASLLGNLFGGAGRDAQRQARVDWFNAAAHQNPPSVIAARVLLGGITNTAGNESPMWQRAVQSLQGSSVLAQAEALGPYWDSSDDDSSSKMRARVETELMQLQQAGGSDNSTGMPSSSTRAQMLPAMQTTAPFNWTPFVIAGGLGAAALLFSSRRRGRR